MGTLLLLLLWLYIATCNSRVDNDYYIDDILSLDDDDNTDIENDLYLYEDEMNEMKVLKWLKDTFVEPWKKDWTKFVQKVVNEASIKHNKDPVVTEKIPFPKKATDSKFGGGNRIKKCVRVEEFNDEVRILRYDEDRDNLPEKGLLGYFQHNFNIKQFIYDFASTGPHLPVEDKLIKDNPKKHSFEKPISMPMNYGERYYSEYPQPNVLYTV